MRLAGGRWHDSPYLEHFRVQQSVVEVKNEYQLSLLHQIALLFINLSFPEFSPQILLLIAK